MNRDEELRARELTRETALSLLRRLQEAYLADRFNKDLPEHERSVAFVKIGRLDIITKAVEQL